MALLLALLLVSVYLFGDRPAAPEPVVSTANTARPAAVTPTPPAGGFVAGEFTPAPATRTPRPTAPPDDGLPTIAFDKLPRQAQETIRLIDRGGPFPYRQDGATFQNRERLLPRQRSGYYREYTVVTPGESDRGPRRIVAGAGGELYYTADHYASFKRVVR